MLLIAYGSVPIDVRRAQRPPAAFPMIISAHCDSLLHHNVVRLRREHIHLLKKGFSVPLDRRLQSSTNRADGVVGSGQKTRL